MGGDEIIIAPDGTFTSVGTENIEAGSVWLNLANGDLNVKKDNVPGTEEGMTKDYIMSFKRKDFVTIRDEKDYPTIFQRADMTEAAELVRE